MRAPDAPQPSPAGPSAPPPPSLASSTRLSAGRAVAGAALAVGGVVLGIATLLWVTDDPSAGRSRPGAGRRTGHRAEQLARRRDRRSRRPAVPRRRAPRADRGAHPRLRVSALRRDPPAAVLRPTVMRLLMLLTVFLLAACGSTTAGGAGPTPTGTGDSLAAGGIVPADNDLTVQYDAGEGSPVQTWQLTCVGFVEGDHPQAEQACAHLKTLEEPFAPLPEDRICTEQYGGPQTAHITGRWAGEPVDLRLSRTNGCEISQWESLVPLVPSASS